MSRDVSTFDVCGEGEEFLAELLAVAFVRWDGEPETFHAWRTWNEPIKIDDLYYGESDPMPALGFSTYTGPRDAPWHPLPPGTTTAMVASFAIAWLETIEYPPRPDTDGSLHKGWRFYNRPYGWFLEHACHVGIMPDWAVYGK